MYSFDGEEDTETSDEDTAPPGTSEGMIVVISSCKLRAVPFYLPCSVKYAGIIVRTHQCENGLLLL